MRPVIRRSPCSRSINHKRAFRLAFTAPTSQNGDLSAFAAATFLPDVFNADGGGTIDVSMFSGLVAGPQAQRAGLSYWMEDFAGLYIFGAATLLGNPAGPIPQFG